MTTNPQCRLLSFKLSNFKNEISKTREFMIQMFGIDEQGKSYSIKVRKNLLSKNGQKQL